MRTVFILHILFVVLAAAPVSRLAAQLHYGFKAGLNFSRIDGPSELDDQGQALEEWKNQTSFHLGLGVSYNFTDNFGLRGEFLYSKRGAKYTYGDRDKAEFRDRFGGQMYRIFKLNNTSVVTSGSGSYLVNINNSYFDLPVTAFARVGDFEFSAGGYIGLLVQTVGDGAHTYINRSVPPVNTDTLRFNVDYNYRRDDPGEGKSSQVEFLTLQNSTIELPKNLGAYYDYPEDKGSLFNAFDYGLVGGFSYFISNTLFAHVRYQYGLADITRNEADLARARLAPDGSRIYRSDVDRNVFIQVSIGFSF